MSPVPGHHTHAAGDSQEGKRSPFGMSAAAAILTHRSDRLDQSGGYGEASRPASLQARQPEALE